MSDEREQKLTALSTLCLVLGKKRYTPFAIEAMLRVFDDVTAADFQEASDYLLQTATDLPPLADIRDGIKSGQYKRVKVIEQEGDWEAACRLMDMADLGLTSEVDYEAYVEEWEVDQPTPYRTPGVDL